MPNKKTAIIFLIVLIFLFSNTVPAIKVNSLEIAVDVDPQGFAKVTENYRLSFISDFELEDFKKASIEDSTSLAMWTADFNFFYPHFGPRAGLLLSASSIGFDDKSRTLTLEYTSDEKFAKLVKSEQRSDFFTIENRRMNAFNDSGIIVIPENTAIKITLPQNANIDTESLPSKIKVFGNQLELNAVRSNSVEIKYIIVKSIIQAGNEIIPGVQNIYLLIMAAALLIAVIYIRRSDLEKWIEKTLVEHSEIKGKHNDEEIEFDS